MTQTLPHGSEGIHYLLWLWFSLTALSVAYVAYDQSQTGDCEQMLAKKMKRLGWVLFTLYTGPFSVLVYRLVRRGTRVSSMGDLPLWQRAAHSVVHCAAGQLTGMLLAALIASGLHLSRAWELLAEYVGGISIGLFLFKAPSMQALAGSYWRAARGSWLSETLAMNIMMAGQIPVMAILMTLDMRAMNPNSVLFWGTMSFSFIAGSLTTYPLMWLLNSNLLEPDLSAAEQGQARHSNWRKLAALLLTLAALAGAVGLAQFGGFFNSMEPM